MFSLHFDYIDLALVVANNYICTNTLCWLVRTQSVTKPQCNVMLVDTNANNYICTNTPCWLVWIQSVTKPQCSVMLVDTNANNYMCTNTQCNVMIDCYKLKVMRTPNAKCIYVPAKLSLHWIFAALCVRANQSTLCIWRSHHFEFVTINHYIALGVRTHVVIGVRINQHYNYYRNMLNKLYLLCFSYFHEIVVTNFFLL
jgi:hypothetical protein